MRSAVEICDEYTFEHRKSRLGPGFPSMLLTQNVTVERGLWRAHAADTSTLYRKQWC